MPRKRKPTTDAVEIMHRRYFEGRPERIAALEKERARDASERAKREAKRKATRRSKGPRKNNFAELIYPC